MRIEVDEVICEANAICVGIAEDLFRLRDDEDVVDVLVAEVPGDREDDAREAADRCPRQALRIVEG